MGEDHGEEDLEGPQQYSVRSMVSCKPVRTVGKGKFTILKIARVVALEAGCVSRRPKYLDVSISQTLWKPTHLMILGW